MNKKEKIVNRLKLDSQNKIEIHLKHYNTETSVNDFVESEFFSLDVPYETIWKRFKEYIFEFNSNL